MIPGTGQVSAAGCPEWMEWKRVCALGGCSMAVRTRLQQFAHGRFRRCVDRLQEGPWSAIVPTLRQGVEPAQAWHLFESHLEIRNTREGKRYKDWLFARVPLSEDAPQSVIEGGASLIIRDVVRDHVRREWQARGQVSLTAPLGAGHEGDGLSLEDLLPAAEDALGAVARREYTRLAETLATTVFEGLPPRTRVAVLARALDLFLHDPRVLTAAQCGKTVLSEAYVEYRRALRARIECEFADEDHAGRMYLLCQTALGVQECVFGWGRLQPHCAAMLRGHAREPSALTVEAI